MSQRDRKPLFSSVEQLRRKHLLADVSSDLSRTILSVSRQHLGAIGSLHALAERGVNAVENAAEQTVEAVATIEENMVRLEWHVQQASESIAGLTARFDWGMSELLASIGGMSDSIGQLVGLATTPAQTAAYEQFEIARDAFRRRLYPECLEALNRAIDGDDKMAGYRLEWRFHMLRGVVLLGDLPEIDDGLVDREQARDAFINAARYAETDEPKEAARALLAASRAAFVEKNVVTALQNVERAIEIAPDMAESHYRAAKYRAGSSGFEAAVPSLRAAIHADPMYLLKIAADPTFQQHEENLDEFLSTVRREQLESVQPPVRAASEAIRGWSRRCIEVADHPAWQRWTTLMRGADGWGFFDLHRYEAEGFDSDRESLGELVRTLADLEERIRASLASVEDECNRYAEIASHATVARWRRVADGGDIDPTYSAQVTDDLKALRQAAIEIEEVEAQVQDAYARFARLAERCERIAGHPTMMRWREMIEGRRWKRTYRSQFEAERVALEELVTELSEYRIERVKTQVERHVAETTEEGRWLFKRKTTRMVRRLVQEERTVLVNGLGDRIPGPEMIDVSPGEFRMGPGQDEDAEPHEWARRVAITKRFQLAAKPITQQLWEAVTGENPSTQTGIFRPVHGVSWQQAVVFCNRISELFDFEPAYEIHESMLGVHVRWKGLDVDGFRLPTEAEWEYACRAGDEAQRYGKLDDIAWHRDNSGGHPHPVGRKQANAWGFADMIGNVENWVWDYAPEDDDLPPQRSASLRRTVGGSPTAEQTDPTGPAHGSLRISRGDGFLTAELFEDPETREFVRRFRAAGRRFRRATDDSPVVGLRLCRSVTD